MDLAVSTRLKSREIKIGYFEKTKTEFQYLTTSNNGFWYTTYVFPSTQLPSQSYCAIVTLNLLIQLSLNLPPCILTRAYAAKY